MATRQYIGARYVPKFYENSVDGSTQWESNVVYDPLIYVTLQNGHMYISKKQVPATVGTPASNVDYWLDMGSYNGFIDSLQNQIDAHTEQIEQLMIETNLQLKQRKFVLVGDSYATNYTSGDVNIVGWVDKFISINGLTSNNVSNAHIYRTNGTGFYAPNSRPWLGYINTLDTDEDITDVIFLGGCNDIGYAKTSPTLLANAVHDTINAAKNKFPNAAIWVGFIGFDLHLALADNYIKKCINIWYSETVKCGGRILNNMESLLYNKSYMLNTSHPNNAGLDIIAGALSSALCGGSYLSVLPMTNCNFDLNADIANANATSMTDIFVEVTNNIMHIESARGVAKFNIAMNKSINTDPASVNAKFIIGKSSVLPVGENSVYFTIPALLTFTGNVFKLGFVEFEIYNGYLLGRVIYMDSSGYMTGTLTSIESSRFNAEFDLLSSN